jgi:hypothetical protein
MSILHTIEQLESARAHADILAAVRILHRHLRHAGIQKALGGIAALARLYFDDPAAGLELLSSWTSQGTP